MKKITHAIAFLCLSALASNAQMLNRITVTIAGTGAASTSTDGVNSRTSAISGPKDVCMDAYGNLYVNDKANGVVQKISATKGVITTIAGGGASTADGIPATDAMIVPNYMCISPTGDIYITTGNMIRKISTITGIITTVAGSATAGFGGDGGSAIAAQLDNPQGLCLDPAGNLYVVDRNNQRVRKITAGTGIITTIIGNGTPGFAGDGAAASLATLHGPVCVIADESGNIYVSDQNPNYPGYDNSVIRKIDAGTGIVTHVVGDNITYGGTYDVLALNATLGTITGMCMSYHGHGHSHGHGHHIHCNEMSCSCRDWDQDNDSLYLNGGNFAVQGYQDDINSFSADMNIPYGLCTDEMDNIYIADSNNHRIRKIIQLTHTPTFAYGHGQYFDAVVGTTYPLDSMLWITDMDNAQMETWSVITPPMYGTLTGFPNVASSHGTSSTTKPMGTSYTPTSSYAGSDFFRVRVSDGVLSDTITIWVGDNTDVLSVKPSTTTAAINIFPNPASSVLNVQWSNLIDKNATITIADITDRVYSTTTYTNKMQGKAQIDISALPSGTYMVRLNGTEVKKFVKQ